MDRTPFADALARIEVPDDLPTYDFSDTDCPEVKTFPTAAIVIGCIVVASFLAAVCAAWRAWA